MIARSDRIAAKRTCCPKIIPYVRTGSFYRKSDSKTIQRYKCKGCGRGFSHATGTACFGQNKRRVNAQLFSLFGKGISMRDAALHFNIHRTTVARKKKFIAEQCRIELEELLWHYKYDPIDCIQFDEMETFEHTKLKPLSIALAVHAGTREILGTEVSRMPAKGLLAKKSRAKYGPRVDERRLGMKTLFEKIDPYVSSTATVTSDQNPHYPGWVKSHRATWNHETVKGHRGCIVGGGELKKIAWDPIFSLNHTCAMNRAKISRLFRKTWNTTKDPDRLQDHLDIYAVHHNKKIRKVMLKKLAA